MCLCLIVPAILFPVFAQARLSAKKQVTLTNAKSLAVGNLMYASDNNGRFSDKLEWCDAVAPYVKASEFESPLSPSQKETPRWDYAYFAACSNLSIDRIPDMGKQPVVFESNGSAKNQYGGSELLPTDDRLRVGGKRLAPVGYADGHSKIMNYEDLK
jgi:hypothetical protein